MSGQSDGRVFRRAVEHKDLAYVLHRGGAQRRAKLVQPCFALDLVAAGGFHLDEFMRRKRAVDFPDHRGAQALVANDDDRMAGVRETLEILALSRSELHVEGRFKERAILADRS